MPARICTHIKVTGVRCGSPALRGEQFCYFHQRMHRSVRTPQSRIHPVAFLEDEESIQASIMEVVDGLIRGTVELRRGELILRALNTAVRNSRRINFSINKERMVRDVPEFPSEPLPDIAAIAASLVPTSANPAQPKPPASAPAPPAEKNKTA